MVRPRANCIVFSSIYMGQQTGRSEFENSVAVPTGSRGHIKSRRDIGFLVRYLDPLEATLSSKWKAADLRFRNFT